MAKYVPKKKVEPKKIIFPSRKGKTTDGKDVTLAHNPTTDRYDLKVDGSLVISAPHLGCVRTAEMMEIQWSE